MIYVDTSVVLAYLLGEEEGPGEGFWSQSLVGSRLLQVESWNRLHARSIADSHGALLEGLLSEIAMIELNKDVIARASEPFPAPVRTLDALHLASAEVLRSHGVTVSIATYDLQMKRCAEALGLRIAALDV